MLRNWQFGWVREQVRQLQCGVGLYHAGDTFTTHTPHVEELAIRMGEGTG